MLVGRRDFLKVLASAAAVAAADPAALARTSGDLYVNDRLSLSLVKPVGWHFLSTVDYQAAAGHQLLLVDNPEVEQILKSPEALPFVVMTKFGAQYDDLNPAICGFSDAIEPGVPNGEPGYHDAALKAWRWLLPQAEVVSGPKQVDLRGVPATRSEWRFLYQHDSGRQWTVNVRTLLVFRGERTHTFHLMQGTTPPAIADLEFDAAEQAIEYF